MIRARAIGMHMPGNIQIKGAYDLQTGSVNLTSYPVNGIVAGLFQNQEWGTIAHFFRSIE
jgi:hypothetical protein